MKEEGHVEWSSGSRRNIRRNDEDRDIRAPDRRPKPTAGKLRVAAVCFRLLGRGPDILGS